MFCPLPQGQTASDTLRQWQRTYSRELDHETRQECAATERVLRKAAAGGGEALSRRPRRFRHSLPFLKHRFQRCAPSVTYLYATQWLPLLPQPSHSMPCRTASCLMLRTRSRCCPLKGAAPLARTGPGTTGFQRWGRRRAALSDGRETAPHSDTEREEQRLQSSMG